MVAASVLGPAGVVIMRQTSAEALSSPGTARRSCERRVWTVSFPAPNTFSGRDNGRNLEVGAESTHIRVEERTPHEGQGRQFPPPMGGRLSRWPPWEVNHDHRLSNAGALLHSKKCSAHAWLSCESETDGPKRN